jgi:hypothetical protein
MRTLKLGLVVVFCLASLMTLISSRVAALSATMAQSNTPTKEKSGKAPKPANDAAQLTQSQPVDPSQYVGSNACAECHTDIAAYFAVTAHRKTLSDQYFAMVASDSVSLLSDVGRSPDGIGNRDLSILTRFCRKQTVAKMNRSSGNRVPSVDLADSRQ